MDTEPIYWSWVRAIAAELVRQTPFRAQRCLNFLEILTICPRGPVPLPDSPTETRRRSRSELRYWPSDSPTEKTAIGATTMLDESRRRAKSELRLRWSSSNSSDEDLGEFRSIPAIISSKEQPVSRMWGCSESSEGSDDSLPWGGGVCRSSIDSVDASVSVAEPETREQRIQRYKEARRRENEARSRRVLEEDARRRRERRAEEENNNHYNNNNLPKIIESGRTRSRIYSNVSNDDAQQPHPAKKELAPVDLQPRLSGKDAPADIPTITRNGNSLADRLPPVKPSEPGTVRFEENHRNEDDKRNNNSPKNGAGAGILKSDTCERRSRARERRITRDKGQTLQAQQGACLLTSAVNVQTLRERKERLALLSSRIPVPRQSSHSCPRTVSSDYPAVVTPKSPSSPSTAAGPPREEDVAKLLERCQRVDHYVPVREKLTLFESLSRLGGRLARSTEDLGRTSSKPSPRGKQRARSLHDLNRGARAVPVREMCRFFEGDLAQQVQQKAVALGKTRFSDPPAKNSWKDPNSKAEAPGANASARRKHYLK